MAKRTAVKKLTRLIGFALLLLLFGCSQTSQNQTSSNVAQNQPVVKNKPDEKFEYDDALQGETDALLPLFDNMPQVSVFVTDAPILKSGANTDMGVAYTQCDRHIYPTIYVKKTFYQKANRKQLVNILKHELTHAWLCRKEMMWGHDANFRRKFKQVGGFGN